MATPGEGPPFTQGTPITDEVPRLDNLSLDPSLVIPAVETVAPAAATQATPPVIPTADTVAPAAVTEATPPVIPTVEAVAPAAPTEATPPVIPTVETDAPAAVNEATPPVIPVVETDPPAAPTEATPLVIPTIETDSPAAATDDTSHPPTSDVPRHNSSVTSPDVESRRLDSSPKPGVEDEALSAPHEAPDEEPPSAPYDPWADDEDDSPPIDPLKYTESDDGFDEYDGHDGDDRRLEDEEVLLAEAINDWHKNVAVFDDSVNMDNRPQDLAYTFQSLDNEMIDGFKPHQDPKLLAKYFGFAGADEFEKWNATDRAIVTAMSPLLEFLSSRPATQESAHLKFTAVMQCISENQGRGKRNFTDRKEEHRKRHAWTELHYTACALFELVDRLCVMEDGYFKGRNWSNDIMHNRMWHLLCRVKRRKLRKGEASAAKAKKAKAVQEKYIAKVYEQDPTAIEAAFMTHKAKTSKRLAKVNKKLARSEKVLERAKAARDARDERRRLENLAKGVEAAPKDPLLMGKEEVDLRLEDAVASKKYDEEVQFVLHSQYKACTEQSVLNTLDRLKESIQSNGRAPKLTQNRMDALTAFLGDPQLFDADTFEHDVMSETLDVHLPTMETRFSSRLDEKQANEFANQMMQLNIAAEKNNQAPPNPGFRDAVFALMQVLYPDQWETMVTSKDWGEELTMSDMRKLHSTFSGADTAKNVADAEARLAEKRAQCFAKGMDKIKSMKELAGVLDPSNQGDEKSKFLGALLTNTKWESDEFLAACQFLNVDPGAPIRLPGMRTGGPHLYWFQLLALFAMIKKLEQGVTSGVILAAVVGLGKTITMLAYILWVSLTSICLGRCVQGSRRCILIRIAQASTVCYTIASPPLDLISHIPTCSMHLSLCSSPVGPGDQRSRPWILAGIAQAFSPSSIKLAHSLDL